jgi:acyl-CoA reductase-like NAD-dependent aldehyde dehydrogenase
MTKSGPRAIVLLDGRSATGGTPTMEPTTTTADQAARANGGFDVSMRVGQAWVGPDEREAMQVIDPSTGKTIADVPVATAQDAQSALETAQRAQPAWAALTPRERAEYLQRIAQLVRADAERLSRLISHEEGKPLRESRVEIEGWTAGFFDYFATFARAAHGEILPSDNRGEEIAIRKVPYGVCVGITPWNFPSAMVARKVALDDATDLGPKVTRDELEKVERMVAHASEQGAEIVTGGSRADVPGFEEGFWYEPTVLVVTRNDMEIMQEEIFGPVSPIMAFDDLEEALDLANDSKYGLSAYLFSNDAKSVQRFVEGCDFGELYINKIGPEQLNGHHTGYRLSGILGDDGTHGFEKYSRRRTTYTSWRQETAADLMPFAG